MKWQKTLSRKNSIFMDSTKLLGGAKIYNDIGIDYSVTDYKIVNGDNFITNAYELLVKRLNKKLEKEPSYLKKFIDKCYQDIDNFILLCDNIDKQKILNKNISKQFDIYMTNLYSLMAYLHLPLVIERYLTDNINKIISVRISPKENHKKYQEIYFLFTSAKKRSAVQQEKIEFLNLAQKIKNNKKFKKEFKLYSTIDKNKFDLSNLINKHLHKWAWLGDHNFKGNFWSQNDLIARLSEQIKRDCQQEKNSIITSEREIELKYKKAIKKFKLSSAEKKLIDITREFVYLRTYRLDVLFISLYKVWPLFIGLENKLNIKANKLLYLTPIEINLLLNNKILKQQAQKIIQNRIMNSVLILKKGKLKIYTGQLAVNKFKEKEIINKTEMIIGATAYPGKVKGTVRIVNTVKDLKKVKKGDILVTSMTTPDFVPAMEKASSFITNEGGILCHAAIISREMKKPCIIGTKIATQVLKDGDLVEVDANKGVVIIL